MMQAAAWSTYVPFLFFDKDYREPELATSMGCGPVFLEVKTVTINQVTS